MSRILLIDDDGDMLKLTARWFAKAGDEVSMATSGEEALEILESEGFDIILLDYAMPKMDGPATLEAIRSMDSSKDIPVLFRTGKEDESLSDIMDRLHPAGVVSKTESKPKLMKAVSDILSMSL